MSQRSTMVLGMLACEYKRMVDITIFGPLLIVAWHKEVSLVHDDVIKWKHFSRYWPSVRGIHGSPVTSQHKGQLRGALMFSLICACINDWVNNHDAGVKGRHSVHYDVTVMQLPGWHWTFKSAGSSAKCNIEDIIRHGFSKSDNH